MTQPTAPPLFKDPELGQVFENLCDIRRQVEELRAQLKKVAAMPAAVPAEIAEQELRLDQLDASLEADTRTITGKRHDG